MGRGKHESASFLWEQTEQVAFRRDCGESGIGKGKWIASVSVAFSPTGMVMTRLRVFVRSFRPSFIFIAQPTTVQAPSACWGACQGPCRRQRKGPSLQGSLLTLSSSHPGVHWCVTKHRGGISALKGDTWLHLLSSDLITFPVGLYSLMRADVSL